MSHSVEKQEYRMWVPTHLHICITKMTTTHTTPSNFLHKNSRAEQKQEGHDGPVSLHWLIREIHSYHTLHYLGIGLKHKTPYKD